MKVPLSIILIIIVFFSCPLCSNASIQDDGKLILIVMDRIGWKDIHQADTPNLDAIMEKGGIGLMTSNTAGALSQRNAYITIGAGARATGSAKSHLSLGVDEIYEGIKAGDIYFQITGRGANQGSIVNLGIAQVYKNNSKRTYDVNVGALGTVLRDAGYNVAVVGNCDTPKGTGHGYKRYLASMMMDENGLVPAGETGQVLLAEDMTRPLGIKTDYDYMEELVMDLWDKTDIIAVQLGDTSRVEDFRSETSDSMLEKHRRLAIEEGDSFIGRLATKMDFNRDLMMIISIVGPARELQVNNRLTPVIIAGRGMEAGWLTSGSTHRQGVVTNLDIGITILDFFGLSPVAGQTGARISAVPAKGDAEKLIEFNQRLVEIINQRGFLVKSYITVLILVLAAAVLVLLFNRRYIYCLKVLLIFIMLVPLSFLLLPLFHQPGIIGSVLISLAIAVILTAAVLRFVPAQLGRIIVICGGTAIALVVDQWTGSYLIQGSPLGYDVINAARFYGIGNEYMGVLVGATCTGWGAFLQKVDHKMRSARLLSGVFALFVLYTISSPWRGANVGGGITAFISFGAAALLLNGKKIRLKHIAIAAGVLMVVLVALFLSDYLFSADKLSHMGQTVELVRQKGINAILGIISRKLAMNIRLFKYTWWTRVFIASLIVVVILFYRPVGIFNELVKKYRLLKYGLISATLASVVAFATNDSGIVAAATCMIYIAPPFILLIADRIQEKIKRGEAGMNVILGR